MTIFLAPNQKLSSLIFTFFFFLSTSSKLPSARCPTSQISPRTCCHYLIPFFSCLIWVTVGWSRHSYLRLTDEGSIFSLLSKLLKMYFLGLQTFSLLSWVPWGLSPSLLIIWNLHQVMSFQMVNKARCLPLEEGWCGGGGRKTKHSYFSFDYF